MEPSWTKFLGPWKWLLSNQGFFSRLEKKIQLNWNVQSEGILETLCLKQNFIHSVSVTYQIMKIGSCMLCVGGEGGGHAHTLQCTYAFVCAHTHACIGHFMPISIFKSSDWLLQQNRFDVDNFLVIVGLQFLTNQFLSWLCSPLPVCSLFGGRGVGLKKIMSSVWRSWYLSVSKCRNVILTYVFHRCP